MDEEEFGRDLAEAIQSPRSRNAFLRYSFNVWAQSVTAWIDHEDWKRAAVKNDWPVDGASCASGLDLAKTSDMSAFVMVFPRRHQEPSTLRASSSVLATS